jgi:hypothetical protein
MTTPERRPIIIDDDENRRLHAIWSRSGKRLIVTATTPSWTEYRQVELRPEQVDELIRFLNETLASDAAHR